MPLATTTSPFNTAASVAASDINHVLPNGRPLLSSLIQQKRDDATDKLIHDLIQRGADVTIRDINGNPPLFFAVLNDRADIFDLLMAHGGSRDINSLQKNRMDGISLLQIAISHKRHDMALKLIAAGANVNHRDHNNDAPIVEATRGLDIKMMQLLAQSGADIAKYETETGKFLSLVARRAAQVMAHDCTETLFCVLDFLKQRGCNTEVSADRAQTSAPPPSLPAATA